jgi:hypothetical protein
MEKGAIITRSGGKYRLSSEKVNPKTGKRRNLGTYDTMEQAQARKRQVEYFKHMKGSSELTEYLDSYVKEALDWADPDCQLSKEAKKIRMPAPGFDSATTVAARYWKKKLSDPEAWKSLAAAGGGAAAGGVTGFLSAPWGSKLKGTAIGAGAGAVGGGAAHSYGVRRPYGMLAGPAAGLAAGAYYKKKKKEKEDVKGKLSKARRQLKRLRATPSSYTF